MLAKQSDLSKAFQHNCHEDEKNLVSFLQCKGDAPQEPFVIGTASLSNILGYIFKSLTFQSLLCSEYSKYVFVVANKTIFSLTSLALMITCNEVSSFRKIVRPEITLSILDNHYIQWSDLRELNSSQASHLQSLLFASSPSDLSNFISEIIPASLKQALSFEVFFFDPQNVNQARETLHAIKNILTHQASCSCVMFCKDNFYTT